MSRSVHSQRLVRFLQPVVQPSEEEWPSISGSMQQTGRTQSPANSTKFHTNAFRNIRFCFVVTSQVSGIASRPRGVLGQHTDSTASMGGTKQTLSTTGGRKGVVDLPATTSSSMAVSERSEKQRGVQLIAPDTLDWIEFPNCDVRS